jgi:hypothetical protein
MAAGFVSKDNQNCLRSPHHARPEPLPTSNLSVFAHFIGLWVTKSS